MQNHANQSEFEAVIELAVTTFPRNRFCEKIAQKELQIVDYHSLLLMLFHQVFNSSSSFALAASECGPDRLVARDYLFKHAEEEKTHWKWILHDLKSSGYIGPDPRTFFPPEPCEAYVAFNFHIARKMPIARLGIAMMLESLGANCAKQYTGIITAALGLNASQVVFLSGHSDTDVGHVEEIRTVLRESQLSAPEWGWMCHAAQTAFKMYSRMYDEAV